MVERIHGGAAAGVDFSVNLNPYGPCEPVLAAARAADLTRYPDPAGRGAREAWARTLACDMDELAVGHGAADLLWAIARAFLAPGARAAIAEPTFSEFAYAAEACGAEVVRTRTGLQLELESIEGAAAVYVCSPNNPTGEYIEPARIAALAARNTAVVLDQSFLGLSAQRDVPLPANVIRVRSLTKEFALPGLRIGLCRAHPAWIERIEAQRPTWSTSSAALAALTASASEHEFVRQSFLRMREDREAVRGLLQRHGFETYPSETSYQLALIPARFETAKDLVAALYARGVALRDCASFGLPRHVRVAALPAPSQRALAAALDDVCGTR